MLKLLSGAAALALAGLANASVFESGNVTFDLMVVKNASGKVIPTAITPGDTYTTAQTSEILYGEDSASASTSRERTALTSFCTSSLSIPEADMGATSCVAGPTGVWSGSSWSSAAPSAVGSAVYSKWTVLLQPGDTLTFSGAVTVHAASQGGAAPSNSPVGQYSYSNAHAFWANPGYGLFGVNLSVAAGPGIAQDSASQRFSESISNPNEQPIGVLFDVVITTQGLNAAPVPEPSAWLMWLAVGPVLAGRLWRGVAAGCRQA